MQQTHSNNKSMVIHRNQAVAVAIIDNIPVTKMKKWKLTAEHDSRHSE